jgi:acylphosphatase
MAGAVARKVRLYGRVQGVFFRQWSVHQARELGVGGWVRNLPNGSVEAYLTGDDEAVSAMVARLRQGPPDARVEDVMVEDAAPEEVDGFSVRV